MAANLEGLQTLEELYIILSLLQKDLLKSYKSCLHQRCETECCVRRCKRLVRPWTWHNTEGNKEKSLSPDDSTNKTAQEDDQKIKSQPQHSTSGQTENTTETPDLELLEKILTKAQHAREVQKKLDEDNTSTGPGKKGLEKPARKTDTSRSNITTASKSKSTNTNGAVMANRTHTSNPKLVSMATKPRTTGHPMSSKPVVEQPVLMKRNVPKQIPFRTTYSAAFGTKPTAGPSTGLALPSNEPKDDNTKYSHVNKAGKPQLPITVTATTARPKGRTEQPKTVSKNTTTSKNQSSTHYCKGNADSAMLGTENVHSLVTDEEVTQQRTENIENVTKTKDKCKENTHLQSTELLETGVNTDVKSTEGRTSELDMTDIFQTERVKPFNLIEDGNELALPRKYRKLKSSNSKLVSQLKQCCDRESAGMSLSGQFIERLEKTFDCMTEMSHKDIKQEAKSLLESHGQLMLLTHSVIERSAALSQDTSWEEVYKCYRHWQFVLSKFRELQQRTQALMAAEEFLQHCCPCGGCSAGIRSSPCSSHSVVQLSTEGPRATAGCSLFTRWLPTSMTQTVTNTSSDTNQLNSMTYMSIKELKTLNHSLHEAQLSSLNLYIQRQVGQAMLEVLSHLEPSHRLFVPLYRMVYGLLCCEGKAFPSMVFDASSAS